MLTIRNSLVYLKVEERLLYRFRPMAGLKSTIGGPQWLTFSMSCVQSYYLRRRWYFCYFLEFSTLELGMVNEYSLPLPGLRRNELKALIDEINLYTN